MELYYLEKRISASMVGSVIGGKPQVEWQDNERGYSVCRLTVTEGSFRPYLS